MSVDGYFNSTRLHEENLEATLRDCQKGALDNIKKHFAVAPKETALVVLPTGTGKSLVMLLAPYAVRNINGRCLILTPRPSITRAVLSSRALLTEHGLLEEAVMPQVLEIVNKNDELEDGDFNKSTNQFDPDCLRKMREANFIVVNVHKTCGHPGPLKALLDIAIKDRVFKHCFIGMMIVDEAHHVISTSYQNIIEWLRKRYLIMILYATATPFRGDEMETKLLRSQSTEVFRFSLAEAMRLKYVKRLSFHEYSLASMKFVREEGLRTGKYPDEYEFDTSELDEKGDMKFLRDEANTKDCQDQVLEEACTVLNSRRSASQNGIPHKLLVKVKSGNADTTGSMQEIVEQLEHIGRNMPAFAPHGGLRAAFLYGKTKPKVKQDIMDRFESHEPEQELHALVVMEMLMEGYDNKYITVCANLDPMGSTGFLKFSQFVGRLLRRIPNGSEEDNHAVLVVHQLGEQRSFWKEYIKAGDVGQHSIDVQRRKTHTEFQGLRRVGYTPNSEPIRVSHFPYAGQDEEDRVVRRMSFSDS